MTIEELLRTEDLLSRDQVVAELSNGYPAVSEREFDRWRNQGLIPTPKRNFLGAAGSESLYPVSIIPLAREIKIVLDEKRCLGHVTVEVFLRGFEVPIGTVRHCLSTTLEKGVFTNKPKDIPYGEYADQLADKAYDRRKHSAYTASMIRKFGGTEHWRHMIEVFLRLAFGLKVVLEERSISAKSEDFTTGQLIQKMIPINESQLDYPVRIALKQMLADRFLSFPLMRANARESTDNEILLGRSDFRIYTIGLHSILSKYESDLIIKHSVFREMIERASSDIDVRRLLFASLLRLRKLHPYEVNFLCTSIQTNCARLGLDSGN